MRSREPGRPVERLGDRQRGDVRDVPAVHGHREDLRAQPPAPAGGARLLDHELLELGPDVLRLRLLEPPLEVRHDALERRDVAVLAALVAVADDDLLVLRGVEEELDRLVRQVLDRRRDAPAARREHRLGDLHPPAISVGILFHGHQRAGLDALRPVRDHEVRVDDQLRAQARARGARAVRRVERERARLELVDRRPVERAAVALAEAPLLERRPARRRVAPARRARRPRRGAGRSRPSRRAATCPGPGRPASCPGRSAGRARRVPSPRAPRRGARRSGRRRPRSCGACTCRASAPRTGRTARRPRAPGRSPACGRPRRRGRPRSCGP